MTNKIRVGLFVLIGASVLAVVIVILGKINIRPGYRFNIIFDDISGLTTDSPVRIAGVQVGKVLSFEITKDGKAMVTVRIDQKYRIYHGCTVRVVSTGVIGTKYLQITTGGIDKPLIKDGEVIMGLSSVSIEEILESLKPATGEEPLGEVLRGAIENIRSITGKIDMGIEDENDIKNIVKNIRSFTDTLRKRRGDLDRALDRFPELIESAQQAFEGIQELADKLSDSEGTFGTLVNDKKVAGEVKETVSNLKRATDSAHKVLNRMTGFKTLWDYKLDYNTDDGKYRNDLGIKIMPQENKFYYLGVSNIKEKSGATYDMATSSAPAAGQKISSFNAYLGKTFGRVTIYGGLLRSSGGFGFSLKPVKFLSLNSEVYRFDRKVASGTKPWVDVTARIRFASWLYANLGAGDVLEGKDMRVGLNFVYDDEDLPYLFGLGSLATSMPK
ncbi:MAG: MlaD family protein [bacterium]